MRFKFTIKTIALLIQRNMIVRRGRKNVDPLFAFFHIYLELSLKSKQTSRCIIPCFHYTGQLLQLSNYHSGQARNYYVEFLLPLLPQAPFTTKNNSCCSLKIYKLHPGSKANICRKSAKICPVPFSVFLDLVIKTITFILSSDVRCQYGSSLEGCIFSSEQKSRYKDAFNSGKQSKLFMF